MSRNRVFKVTTLSSNLVFKMNISSNGTIIPLDGVEFKFLNLLSSCMNFKYEILVPEDGEFGSKKENGRWSGMVGMTKRGEADFGLNMIARTWNRNNAVNFSYPYMIDGTTFITEVPKPLPKTLSYFFPFDEIVWLFLLLILLVAPIIFKYIMLRRYPLSRMYFEIFGTFLQQPLQIELTKLSHDILCAAWFIYVRLTTLCYSVVLLSFLTIPLMSKGIYTVNQVAQAVARGTHKCYLYGGTADQDAFYSATEGPLKIIGETIKKHKRLLKHGNHITQYIKDSKTILIGSNTLVVFNYMDGVYKNYFVSKDFFYITQFAIPVAHNFCCLKKMNKCIFRLVAAGLYQKLMDDAVDLLRAKSHFAQDIEDEKSVLEITDISGAFIILIGGCLLAGITFGVEVLYYKKKNKNKQIIKSKL